MKIITYLYYFFRSVFLRGMLNTIRLLKTEIGFEKKFKIKTTAIKRSDSKEFFHYQGASYLVLFRIFNEMIRETKGFNFVDIGCGKGRAVFVAEYCGYDHVTGIELDEALVNEANDNVHLYPYKRKESVLTFLHANALDYEYKNKPTVYFLFNPFNEDVLEKVLDKILLSCSSGTWFIYMNPLYPAPFKKGGMEQVRKFKTRFYMEALVFRVKTGIGGLH